MQNVVGPTLVAMATKFALGAGIKSPTGLSVCVSVCVHRVSVESAYEFLRLHISKTVGGSGSIPMDNR